MTPAAEHLTLADLAAPTIAAEVELGRIPEFLGEIEWLRAALLALPCGAQVGSVDKARRSPGQHRGAAGESTGELGNHRRAGPIFKVSLSLSASSAQR